MKLTPSSHVINIIFVLSFFTEGGLQKMSLLEDQIHDGGDPPVGGYSMVY